MRSMSPTLFRRKHLCFGAAQSAVAFSLIVAVHWAAARSPVSAYPLNPLSKDEIRLAVRVLKSSGKISESSRFPYLALREPLKEEVLNFRPGNSIPREAFVVTYERSSNKTFEALIDIAGKKLLSWKEIPGVQPSYLNEEGAMVEEIVRHDPQWQEALRKRGITDFKNVKVDDWAGGYFGFPDEEGIRVRRAVSYYRGSAKNPFARPVEGVVAYVDLNAKKVIRFIDTGVVPVPRATADFDAKSIGKMRESPKPFEITQPRGMSFEVQGHEVRWQNWRFRFAMNPREGLVLYTVGYEDQGKLRSVLYRASLSEMVVPYGDPSPGWFFRNAFDEGEDSMGRYANSLEPLTDAPANAVFYDAVFADEKGSPVDFHRAVALYERDGGLLWKHFDRDSGKNESRRARELVLSWIATVGNYEYGFNWVFQQDGALEMEVLLTGVMETEAVTMRTSSEEGTESSYGHLVAPNLEAVHHQHFFNFRLDMDVDGSTGNSVVELNTEAVPPGPGNPQMNAFAMKENLLITEKEGQRQASMQSSRKWEVVNTKVKNALGEAVGYTLVPGENSIPYADPNSWVRKRAGFINSHLWVTPYDPEQIYAAGFYVNQSKGGDGLPKWTAANRSIENQDIVLWYTLGVTHMPRPEEWPVMPVKRAGFRLVPSGFFSRNPAVDVPRPERVKR